MKQQGIGFTSLLGLTFIILKLTKVIDWSWWLVLLPFYFWTPIVVILIFIVGKKKKRLEKRRQEYMSSGKPVMKSRLQQKLEDIKKQREEEIHKQR